MKYQTIARVSVSLMLCAAPVALAQDVKSFEVPAAKPVLVPESGPANPDVQRPRFIRKLDAVKTHHRPVPIKPALAIEAARAEPIKPPQLVFEDGLRINKRVSVTSKAKVQAGYASPISEPSVAVRGKEIVVTGNWYAAVSLDAGETFTQLDPFALFGTISPGQEFCCDQLVAYEKGADALVWLMQGTNDTKGNTIRLMVASGEEGIRKQRWRAVDLSSAALLGADGWWFDFPDMASSDKHLYITFNVFSTTNDDWGGGIVIRLDKAKVLAGQASQAQVFRTDTGSLRLTQGAAGTMYWAGHNSRSDLYLWAWKDADAKPGPRVALGVDAWAQPRRLSTQAADGPTKRPWLNRLDGRVTAAWLAKDVMGFAWTAGADERYSMPHIRVATLRESEMPNQQGAVRASGQPHLWSGSVAVAYPTTAPNDAGDVGVMLAYGGPKKFPGFAVGILPSDSSKPLKLTNVTEGKNSPMCPRSTGMEFDCGVWGDYFTLRRHGSSPAGWVVVGYSVGNLDPDPLNVNAEYIWFER